DVHQIADALRRGDAVMMHCAAGIGRTGTTAACVLKALGLSNDEALQRVLDAGSNPENAHQSGLVDWF
ncbi:MAG: tyrosine-protein phosphatase, partial [Ramlibacter sp.]